jgi:hypothetical protein
MTNDKLDRPALFPALWDGLTTGFLAAGRAVFFSNTYGQNN